MPSIRPLTTTHPGVDLTTLLALCRAESAERPLDARAEVDALLVRALTEGRLTEADVQTLRGLLARLPSEDAARIRDGVADAISAGRIAADSAL